MRTLSLVLFTLSSIAAAAAADLPSLSFPDVKIELPPLSLAEAGKTRPLSFFSDAGAGFGGMSSSVAPAKKLISKMPIAAPPGVVDPKMVKIPDPSVDYKLIVKAPDVESAK
jgi:hypothetical protein